jgi:hypothetical protein
MRARSIAWFIVYLALCTAVLGTVGYLLQAHKDDLFAAVARYVFPSSWHFAAKELVERFLKAQVREVLINATVGTSMLLLSMLLFPIKERLSAAVERDARLSPEAPRELPLWLQALEEVWLFLMFLTAQLSIFWLGYSQDPKKRTLAVALSYLLLFAHFGIDFISPSLQRHSHRYSTILKVLLKHPIRWLLFGAVFTVPTIIAGKWSQAHPEWTFARAVGVLFGTNVVCIALAAVAGTYVGCRLLTDAAKTRRPWLLTRLVVAVGILAALGYNLRRYGAVGLSLHHKSQILKCHYRVVPGTLHMDLPRLPTSLDALWKSELKLILRMDLEIENPTPFDVEIEENRIVVSHAGTPVALTRITPVAIPAGQKRTPHIELPIGINAAALKRGRELFDADKWTAMLYLQVTESMELPVKLK